jgi:hypothetical protein
MMLMNTTGVAAPDGPATRAFSLGTVSFGDTQNGRVHTVS